MHVLALIGTMILAFAVPIKFQMNAGIKLVKFPGNCFRMSAELVSCTPNDKELSIVFEAPDGKPCTFVRMPSGHTSSSGPCKFSAAIQGVPIQVSPL